MLSIGEFSKVTGLTVKTLRLYDEKGLLPPASVSDDSGYRYYDGACVERARVVKELRDLDFSLEEIAQILQASSAEGDVVSFLEKHREAIAQKLKRYEEIQQALEVVIRQEKEAKMSSQQAAQFSIEEKTLGPVLVAGIRAKGRYEETGKRLGKIARAVGRHLAGAPLGLYFDGEYRDQDADFESCFPIKQAVQKEGVEVHTLEGGRCVSLVHQGPYQDLGRSYQRVFEYLRAHGLRAKAPIRELYLKGPGMIFKGNPKKYLTEIQILVEG